MTGSEDLVLYVSYRPGAALKTNEELSFKLKLPANLKTIYP